MAAKYLHNKKCVFNNFGKSSHDSEEYMTQFKTEC